MALRTHVPKGSRQRKIGQGVVDEWVTGILDGRGGRGCSRGSGFTSGFQVYRLKGRLPSGTASELKTVLEQVLGMV